MAKKKSPPADALQPVADYGGLLADVVSLLESARRTSVRAVNAVMTATYWEIGRRIVEVEQRGDQRADYGDELVKRLAADLTSRFGRGFSDRSLYKMRLFYLSYANISPTLSAKSNLEISPTLSAELRDRISPASNSLIHSVAIHFPLPWSHYVKLLAVDDPNARLFYEKEALRGGWSVRQMDRQISTLFYQRTLLSKNKAAMLRKGSEPQADDLVTPDEEIKGSGKGDKSNYL